MDNIQLLVDDTLYSGWKAVSVRRSLDLFANTFDLTLTDNQAGQARTIRLGSPCQVRIGGETVVTGYVDRIRPRYDARSRSLTVSGRSKTADLVDCSPPPGWDGAGQYNRRTLLQLAATLAKPFGISVRSEVDDLPVIQISNLEQGQPIFEFLELYARQAGVRLVTDPDGNLVITRASVAQAPTALVLGENIEEAEGEFSERNRFSHYYVTGQRPNQLDDNAEAAAHIAGMADDVRLRYRPTVINAEGPLGGMADASRRAEWQRNVQYGRSRKATYTVSGWRHRDGLWQPNTNVKVIDEWMGFEGRDGKGEWLMIGTVEYVSDERGQRTRLTVMPREAYDLVPLPAEDAGAL